MSDSAKEGPMTTRDEQDRPDFEALRAKRNAEVQRALESAMKKLDPDFKGPIRSTFNPDACYCACPDGPCEHKWDGEPYESDNCWSTTCSRCGCASFSHDLRVLP